MQVINDQRGVYVPILWGGNSLPEVPVAETIVPEKSVAKIDLLELDSLNNMFLSHLFDMPKEGVTDPGPQAKEAVRNQHVAIKGELLKGQKELSERPDLAETIKYLNVKKFTQSIKTEFYDRSILELMRIITIATLVFGKDYTKTFGFNITSRSMGPGVRIGKDSVHGYVLLNAFLGAEKALLVKGINQGMESENLYYEAAIGATMNVLRSVCPNFMYTYAIFTCVPPVSIKQDGQNYEFGACRADVAGRKDVYLGIEVIPDAIPLSSYIVSKKTDVEKLSIFTQLILALALAYSKMRFYHSDLHTGNVLVRPGTETIKLCYDFELENQKYLINFTTMDVATIIDFGNSSNKFMQYNPPHYRNFVHPLDDIFSIIGFSFRTCILKKYDGAILYFLRYLLQFFMTEEQKSDEDFVFNFVYPNGVTQENGLWYRLSYEDHKDITMAMFLKYFLTAQPAWIARLNRKSTIKTKLGYPNNLWVDYPNLNLVIARFRSGNKIRSELGFEAIRKPEDQVKFALAYKQLAKQVEYNEFIYYRIKKYCEQLYNEALKYKNDRATVNELLVLLRHQYVVAKLLDNDIQYTAKMAKELTKVSKAGAFKNDKIQESLYYYNDLIKTITYCENRM